MQVQTRAVFSGIAISAYWFVLYQYFPQHLFDLYYFFSPLFASVVANVALVKFAKEGKLPKVATPAKGAELPRIANVDVATDSTNGSPKGSQVNQESKNVQISGEPSPTEVPNRPVGINQDEVRQIVEQKTEAVTAEVAAVREEISNSKNAMSSITKDMDIIKTSIQDLSTSFETTLTDFKAFQAEIANPLNFMRKYFESIDIKNLSDPSLPLPQLQQTPATQAPPPVETAPISNANTTEKSSEPLSTSAVKPVKQVEVEKPIPPMREIKESATHDTANFAIQQMFSMNLTIGKMMAIISLIGEILQKSGPDSVNLLVEQCKMMGLKPEDEKTIYNIVSMLNRSGMSVNDILIMIYKFAQVVGINDKEADMQYAKLVAGKSSELSSITPSTELIPRKRD